MSGGADRSARNLGPAPAMRRILAQARATLAARIWPEINLSTNDRQHFEHAVELPGLTVHALKGVFARVMGDRWH